VSRVERAFDARVAEVGAARAFAGAVAAEWGVTPVDLILVVGELATNAVCHARSPFAVSLLHSDGAVTVEVTDTSPTLPWLGTPDPQATSGRGLLIVDRVARAWGARPMPGGKTVWAELAL
jgi:anti-sigma regulatory factor (Ser/Thr protein kinase)